MNTEHSNFTGAQVLVVDDDLFIQQAVGSILEGWGCDATVVGSIAEAKAHLVRKLAHPCLIMLDNSLPDGKGLDAVPSLRELCPESQMVVITGDVGPSTQEKAKAVNVRLAYKPASMSDIEGFVREAYLARANQH